MYRYRYMYSRTCALIGGSTIVFFDPSPVPHLTTTESSSPVKPLNFFWIGVFSIGVFDWGNEFDPKIVPAKSNSSIIVFKTIIP